MSDEAFRALQRQMQKLAEDMSKHAGETPVVLFGVYAEQYLSAKLARPKLRASTKRSFENQVRKHLIPRFGSLPIDKITNAVWLAWIEDEKGIKKFFNARKSLIEVLRAAKEDDVLAKVPSLDNPDEYEPVGRVLLLEEIYKILWHSNRPFRLIWFCFWKMGCRPREILQWRWDMIEWVRPERKFSYIRIPARISKTGRNREIPLDPDVTHYLKIRYKRHGDVSPFVFPKRTDPAKPQLSYQSAFVTACRNARVTNAQVYDWRRTFITRAAVAGKPIDFVAKQIDTSAAMIRKFYLKDDADTMEGLFK
jgi:integrase